MLLFIGEFFFFLCLGERRKKIKERNEDNVTHNFLGKKSVTTHRVTTRVGLTKNKRTENRREKEEAAALVLLCRIAHSGGESTKHKIRIALRVYTCANVCVLTAHHTRQSTHIICVVKATRKTMPSSNGIFVNFSFSTLPIDHWNLETHIVHNDKSLINWDSSFALQVFPVFSDYNTQFGGCTSVSDKLSFTWAHCWLLTDVVPALSFNQLKDININYLFYLSETRSDFEWRIRLSSLPPKNKWMICGGIAGKKYPKAIISK